MFRPKLNVGNLRSQEKAFPSAICAIWSPSLSRMPHTVSIISAPLKSGSQRCRLPVQLRTIGIIAR